MCRTWAPPSWPRAVASRPARPSAACAGRRERAALREVARRQLRLGGQAVDLRLVHQQVEGIEAAEGAVGVVPVELGPRLALCLELLDPLLRARPQLGDGAELDRVGGAGLRARGLEPDLEAVVTERAL